MSTLEFTRKPWPEDGGIVELAFTVPSLWSQSALRQVIETATAQLRDISALLEISKRGYGFRLSVKEEFDGPIGEQEFWTRTALFDELDSATGDYVRAIIAYNRGEEKFEYHDNLWHDEEHQAGCFAVEPLAFKSLEYLPLYVDYLRDNDGEHEVYVARAIAGLIEKWGWCDQTLHLYAMRATDDGRGQCEELREKFGLFDYLQRENKTASLAELVAREMEASSDFYFRNMEKQMPAEWGQAVPNETDDDMFIDLQDAFEIAFGEEFDRALLDAPRARIKQLMEESRARARQHIPEN